MENSRKRKCLSVSDKVDIIIELQKGTINSVVCKTFNLSSSTVSTIWKNREAILKAFEENNYAKKKLRTCEKNNVDEALYKWFKIQQKCVTPINGPLLQVQAEKIAKESGDIDFKCSNGWIDRFKKRHGISFTDLNGSKRIVYAMREKNPTKRKTSGRHQGNAFRLYGFDSAKFNGKYIAICRICHKKLQNTAAVRLKGHRNICRPAENQGGLNTSDYNEMINLQRPTLELKTEHHSEDSMQFDNIGESYDVGHDQDVMAAISPDGGNYNGEEDMESYVMQNPLSPPNRKKSFHSTDNMFEDSDIPIPKICLGKGSPERGSNDARLSVNLQNERTRAETNYYRKKADYIIRQTENLQIERKLMILKAQKLRLEIEKIRNEF